MDTDRAVHLLAVGVPDSRLTTAFPDREVTVYEAGDIETGLALFADHAIDCVVCANDLPDGDGVSFCATVSRSEPTLPVVLVVERDPISLDPDPALDALVAAAEDAGVTAIATEADLEERVQAAVVRVPLPAVGHVIGHAITEAVKERAIDEAPVGVTLTDPSLPDNPLVYVNENLQRMTGYTEAEVLGRNCRFLQRDDRDQAAVAEMRAAIENEEPVATELVNYRKDGSSFWNRVTIAPIRDADGAVSHFVGFQTDITARKEAELALEEERTKLDELLDRVEGLVGDVTGAIMHAGTRDEVETALCERLVDAEPYTLAWVGEADLVGERITPNAWAGTDGAWVEDVAIPLAGEDPVALAAETGELQVVSDPPAPHDGSEAGSMAAVPLTYRETEYGVVVVYTDTPDALDDRERAVLTALGRAAATAINALEGRRLLAADDVVELDLELTDPDVFFVRLAASCELSYHGAVHRGDTLSLFFTAEGATGEEITERAAGCPDLSEVTVVTETEDTVVLECAVTPDSLVPLLADRGAETTDITASEGVGRIRVALPDRGEARATVEMVRERHPGTELVASRERQRPSRTRQEFVADLQDRLTDQQLTALRRAYLGGYFEHSRKVNGDDLAKSMGISRSTYHQHLRAAERKLVSAVLEDESRFR